MQHSPRPDILFVDLTRGATRRDALPPCARVDDPGGRGLAGVFADATGTRAFDDPEAVVCFFPGRLAGLDLPGAGHLSVVSPSPRTGGMACAAFGGRLAGALARARLAGVVVTGRAGRPVGLAIRDGEAELVDAGALWGQSTDALFAALGAYDGAAGIGPAAVAGSPLATLVADRWHMAGREGLGLALAAKRLLFLAATGHDPAPVADPAGLGAARAAMDRLIAASPALSGPCGFGRFGTAALVDLTNGRRMTPTRNFRQTFFPSVPDVNAPCLEARFGAHGAACPGCPVGCRRLTPDGRLLPDADALSHLTALLGLADADLALAANRFCFSAGLDPVAAAATLACHAEITDEEPSPARVLELLAAMAAMTGPGRELGRGAAAYARANGHPETAMCVKGLELPAFDPRGAYGLALSLAVGISGPDPWGAGCLAHEILRKPVATDRFTWSGKARAVFFGENAVAAAACLGGCPQLSVAVTLEEWALAFSAATGRSVTAGDLLRIGERTVFRERLQNARRGMAGSNDDLPQRFFTEPGTDGHGIDVPPLSRRAFLEARDRYFQLRGLDANSRPTPERAAALELPWTP
jgi:aldehyde:ferredoxin oxidoreductase